VCDLADQYLLQKRDINAEKPRAAVMWKARGWPGNHDTIMSNSDWAMCAEAVQYLCFRADSEAEMRKLKNEIQ